MSRLRDWEPRLVAYLSGVYHQPFRPGRHDCGLFVAGAVKAMTGVDHARGLRSQYRSIKAGVKRLKAMGFDDHVALVAARLTEVVPALARRGDVAVVAGADGFGALGIVQGEGVYVLTPSGMAVVARGQMVRAFSV